MEGGGSWGTIGTTLGSSGFGTMASASLIGAPPVAGCLLRFASRACWKLCLGCRWRVLPVSAAASALAWGASSGSGCKRIEPHLAFGNLSRFKGLRNLRKAHRREREAGNIVIDLHEGMQVGQTFDLGFHHQRFNLPVKSETLALAFAVRDRLTEAAQSRPHQSTLPPTLPRLARRFAG